MTGIPVPGLRGQHLYELSELAGPGSSGSPIVSSPWCASGSPVLARARRVYRRALHARRRSGFIRGICLEA